MRKHPAQSTHFVSLLTRCLWLKFWSSAVRSSPNAARQGRPSERFCPLLHHAFAALVVILQVRILNKMREYIIMSVGLQMLGRFVPCMNGCSGPVSASSMISHCLCRCRFDVCFFPLAPIFTRKTFNYSCCKWLSPLWQRVSRRCFPRASHLELPKDHLRLNQVSCLIDFRSSSVIILRPSCVKKGRYPQMFSRPLLRTRRTRDKLLCAECLRRQKRDKVEASLSYDAHRLHSCLLKFQAEYLAHYSIHCMTSASNSSTFGAFRNRSILT